MAHQDQSEPLRPNIVDDLDTPVDADTHVPDTHVPDAAAGQNMAAKTRARNRMEKEANKPARSPKGSDR